MCVCACSCLFICYYYIIYYIIIILFLILSIWEKVVLILGNFLGLNLISYMGKNVEKIKRYPFLLSGFFFFLIS